MPKTALLGTARIIIEEKLSVGNVKKRSFCWPLVICYDAPNREEKTWQ